MLNTKNKYNDYKINKIDYNENYIKMCGLPKDIINSIINNTGLEYYLINIVMGYYGIYIENDNNLDLEEVKKRNIKLILITVICSLDNININLENIYNYLELDKNKIFGVKLENKIRTLIPEEKKKKKKDKKIKKKKYFLIK